MNDLYGENIQFSTKVFNFDGKTIKTTIWDNSIDKYSVMVNALLDYFLYRIYL